MNWWIVAAAVPSFVVAVAAVPWLRARAESWGLVDRPNQRKIHDHPIPLCGGLAIWLGVVVTFLVGQIGIWLVEADVVSATLFPQEVARHFPGVAEQFPKLWFLLAGASILTVLGLIDDRWGVDWRLRITVQVIVAVAMVWQGWQMSLFIDNRPLTFFVSVVWIVGIVNSLNMMDNMDGLASGVATIAAVILASVMLSAPDLEAHGSQLFVAGFLMVLSGAVAGFWCFNMPPATIFMGDAGSYFVGFCLAMATLMATFAGPEKKQAILAPLCVLAVPIYDTLSVIVIRISEGRSPFAADKQHFSHRLVEIGLSRKHAVWTIYLATAACGLGATLLHQVTFAGAVTVLALVAAVLTIIAILETAARRNSR